MGLLNRVYRPKPTAEVYQLRREGNVDQAYHCAVALYRKSPADEDIKKAYAWTLINLCKRAIQAGDIQSAHDKCAELSSLDFGAAYDEFSATILSQIKSLRTKLDPYSDTLRKAVELSKNCNNDEAYQMIMPIAREGKLSVDFHESYGWMIYRYLRDNMQILTSVQVRTALRDYINLQNDRPSNLHSQILNFALNYSRHDHDFRLISFLRLWNPENMTRENFNDSYGHDGKKIPSLMSRIAREVVKYPMDEVAEFIELLPLCRNEFIDMLRSSLFWNIWNLVSEHKTSDALRLFDEYADSYSQYGPSEAHSKVLSLAERVMKEADLYRFYGFFQKWDPSNLRAEDWMCERNENGEPYKPLALKAIKKASDALDACGCGVADFSWLIDAYKVAVDKMSDDEWILRSYAMLLKRAGNVEDAAKIYSKLALELGGKYYVWSEFAACVTDVNVKVGMLCKALSIERCEDFLGNIRLDLAEQLIALGQNGAAAYEIKMHKDHYSSKGWTIKAKVAEMESRCGDEPVSVGDNRALYAKYIPYAEEYAYSDYPFDNYVLVSEWKNDDGKVMQKYVDGNGAEVVLKPGRFPLLKKAKPGQVWCLKVRRFSASKSVPLVVKRSDLPDWSILPVGYGYVQHVNEGKQVYHIYSHNSDLIYVNYQKREYSKGDFVTFRAYSRLSGGEVKTDAYLLSPCDSETAVANYKTAVVAVDGVNDGKCLFHYVMGPLEPSGVIHFDQTDLRPEVGDFLKVHYYVRDRKNVKPGEPMRVAEILKIEQTAERDVKLVRKFTGFLKIKYYDDCQSEEPDFAFIGDYYVHKSMLEKFRITEDCYVTAKAVYSADGKWKVFWINEGSDTFE